MNEILSILSGGAAGAVVVWLSKEWISSRLKESIKHEYDSKLEQFREDLKSKQRISEAKWQLKYEACMQALDISDALLSNLEFSGLPAGAMVREPFSTEAVRDCFNKLACACDGAEVLNTFKKIVTANNISLAIVVDIRNSVRKELGFSQVDIDLDRESAFIVRIGPLADEKIS